MEVDIFGTAYWEIEGVSNHLAALRTLFDDAELGLHVGEYCSCFAYDYDYVDFDATAAAYHALSCGDVGESYFVERVEAWPRPFRMCDCGPLWSNLAIMECHYHRFGITDEDLECRGRLYHEGAIMSFLDLLWVFKMKPSKAWFYKYGFVGHSRCGCYFKSAQIGFLPHHEPQRTVTIAGQNWVCTNEEKDSLCTFKRGYGTAEQRRQNKEEWERNNLLGREPELDLTPYQSKPEPKSKDQGSLF